jgi:multiple RNA-binding domain-containing protein 1
MKISVEKAKLQGDPSLKNKGKKGKNKNIKNNEENNDEEIETKESKIKKILDLSKKTKNADKFDEALKNQKINENEEMKENDNGNENIENMNSNDNENNKDKKVEDKTNDLINKKNLDPKRLYLRNIPFEITEDDIRSKFEKYGTINEIHIPINYKTNQSFGYAYISYETVESSIMAINKMDGEYFMGRRLHISIAEEKYNKPESELKIKYNQKDKSSYKKEKTNKLKSNYNDETNWNYLFLNQNAVIDAVAKRLKIKKEDLLSQNNTDIAVQISAMETTIINETKEWLKQQGINLDILKGKRQDCIRSKTIILVKNISNKTKKENLQNLLERYGNLVRFLLSPSNTLAICEYVNKKHAENCIKHLSYYELDGEPLYLEFAPEGLVSDSKENNKNNKIEEKPKDIINIDESEEENKEENKEEGIDLLEGQGKILFVKNLDFSTNDKQLKKFFEKKDYIVKKVEIAKHLKDGKNVSSGFGFVELKDEKMVLKAMKNLQGALLGGHSLKLSISKSSKNENKDLLKNKRKRETELNDYEYEDENISNNKLLIKNIAFEASKEELRKLFKEYGQVKNLRLPTKIDGSHRGFAFIEFMSHEEAQKVFKELQNTHFYKRKLIIEWAKQDNTIEEIREKTSKKANAINIKTHSTKSKGTAYIKNK